MLEFDCRRYLGWADKDYALKRSVDEYTRQYATPFPGEEINVSRYKIASRSIREMPLIESLKKTGMSDKIKTYADLSNPSLKGKVVLPSISPRYL